MYNKFKKIIAITLSLMLVLQVIFVSDIGSFADTPKTLTGVLKEVTISDYAGNVDVQPNNGVYKLVESNENTLKLKYRLDGNLNDGDNFTTTIVSDHLFLFDKKFEVIDKNSEIAVADIVVTRGNDDKGGAVKVTLKNLEKYRAKTGMSVVTGLELTVLPRVQTKKTPVNQSKPVTVDGTKVLNIEVSKNNSDYSLLISQENLQVQLRKKNSIRRH